MLENAQIGFDFTLSAEEAAVLCKIHIGRDQARQVTLISRETGIHWRRVQQTVKHLIEDHGHCIGTGTKEPFGYYLITEPSEIEAVYLSLRHRAISTLHRAARLKKISVVEVFGQGELEMANERQ